MAELLRFLEGGMLESSLLSSNTKNISNNNATPQKELHSKSVMTLSNLVPMFLHLGNSMKGNSKIVQTCSMRGELFSKVTMKETSAA